MIVSAVGCSDLVPPSDAWLKRSDNVATVGCYMTRQTWILTCDHNGRWTGTFGNCTQRTTNFTLYNFIGLSSKVDSVIWLLVFILLLICIFLIVKLDSHGP